MENPRAGGPGILFERLLPAPRQATGDTDIAGYLGDAAS